MNEIPKTNDKKLVIVVDDHPIFANGLAEMINCIKGYEVISVFNEPARALDFVKHNEVDMVFTDINMPAMNGVELVKAIKALNRDINIAVVTSMDDHEKVYTLHEMGIQAFLTKSLTLAETRKALDLIQWGSTYFAKEMISILLRQMEQPPEKSEIIFSNRDMVIIKGICQQKTTKEIAASLDMSIKSIELARTRIMGKMDCINLAGIVVYAIRKKLITMQELNEQFN
jgi:DNA-binding NarL/FixJ family response regulator